MQSFKLTYLKMFTFFWRIGVLPGSPPHLLLNSNSYSTGLVGVMYSLCLHKNLPKLFTNNLSLKIYLNQ